MLRFCLLRRLPVRILCNPYFMKWLWLRLQFIVYMGEALIYYPLCKFPLPLPPSFSLCLSTYFLQYPKLHSSSFLLVSLLPSSIFFTLLFFPFFFLVIFTFLLIPLPFLPISIPSPVLSYDDVRALPPSSSLSCSPFSSASFPGSSIPNFPSTHSWSHFLLSLYSLWSTPSLSLSFSTAHSLLIFLLFYSLTLLSLLHPYSTIQLSRSPFLLLLSTFLLAYSKHSSHSLTPEPPLFCLPTLPSLLMLDSLSK